VLTRKRKRESDASFATNDDLQEFSAAADQSIMGPTYQEALADESSTQIVADSCPPSPTEHTEVPKHDQDEKEVEDIVNEDFIESIGRSCSSSEIFDSPSRQKSALEDSESLPGQVLEQRHPTPMDVDQDNTLEFAASATKTIAEDVIEVDTQRGTSTAISSVNPTDFYRSKTTQGKQRAAPAPFPMQNEADSEREDPEVDVSDDDKARRYDATCSILNLYANGCGKNVDIHL
jgi:hypothetical protein